MWPACGSGGHGGPANSKSFGTVSASATDLVIADPINSAVNVASINSSGTLSSIAGATFLVGAQPIAMATTQGKFIFVLSQGAGNITQFVIASDGSLSQPQSPAATGLQPSAIAVEPADRFALVANKGSGTISVYSINATTGALVQVGSPITLNVTTPQALAINGNFVFVAGPNAIDVLIFNPATSSFSFATGSPFSAGPATTNIVALYSPPTNNNRVFAVDTAAGVLRGFTLDNTGALVSTGVLATGTRPVALVPNPQNTLLFVANQGSNDLSVFTVDSTGAVAPAAVALVATGTGPNALSYDPVNNFLFVSLFGAKQIVAFSVNTTTGALTPAGTPFAVTNASTALAVGKP